MLQSSSTSGRENFFSHTSVFSSGRKWLNHILIGSLLLVFSAIVWLHTFTLIAEDRARTLDTAKSDLVNLGRVSQEHAERTLFSVEQTLLMVAGQYLEKAGKIDLGVLATQGILDPRLVLQVDIIDARGGLLLSSLPINGPIDFSDQAYFKVHLLPHSEALFISRPVLMQASGQWTIQLSRRISLANGQFGGVIVASIDPVYFTHFYGELNLGQHGSASIVKINGGILARRNGNQDEFNGDISTAAPMMARLAEGHQNGTFISPSQTDGVERVFNFWKLPSYPLLVTFSLASQDVLASHESSKIRWLQQAAIVTIFLTILAALSSLYIGRLRRSWQTHARELAQAREESSALQQAIFNSANFSSIATDAKGVIQIFNVGAERMLGYSAAEVVNQHTPADISDPQEIIVRAMALSTELDTNITPGFEALVFKAARGIEDIYELTYIRKDGSRFPAVVSVTALRDDDNAIIGYLLIGTDNTARKQAEEALAIEVSKRAETERIKNEWLRLQSAALEACGSAVLIVRNNGVIQWVNQAFCQLTGYEVVDAVGHTPNELFKSGVQDDAFYKKLWETVLSGKQWTGELVNRRKNGTRYPEKLTITSVCDAQGQVTHFIAVKEDITDHKRIEEVAKAANRAKSEFLANMSHEIRTPMNGVVGMVDILQKTKLEPMQSRMLDTIHKSALALLGILNDILDYSKIEAGKLTVERIPTYLREVAEGVAQLLAITANTKSVELSVFVAPELPQWIICDPTRLRQVLLNLLGNAVKFTTVRAGQPAQVMLSVVPCTLAQGKPGVQLRIIDNGIGISPQALANLFQPFTQADESTARKFGGTGLGLSISQRLVELLDGHISVRSTLDEGSEFTVELPLQACAPGRMPVFGPSLLGVQVLVAVRDITLQKTALAYIHEGEASVTVLADLAAVRQHLQQLPPDTGPTVVLLGCESAAPATDLPAGVGVVQLTTRGDRQKGGDEFMLISHPLIYSDLIRALSLASSPLAFAAAAQSAHIGISAARVAPTIEQALAIGQLVLLADDNDTNRDVMTEQLRLLGYACEVAFDGVQALAMWRTGRYALLLTDCHMPHMDGFELTEAIRQTEPVGTRLPIVAITANVMQGEAERCRARGMDDYLSKPLRMVELAPMLQKWLPLATQGLQALLAEADTTPGELPMWDATTLGQMVGDNPAMHRHLLEQFLVSAEKQVAAIVLSIDAGEFSAAADVAHALKSASRMVGALQLGELCEQIETAGSDGEGPACRLISQDLAPILAQARISITQHMDGLAT